MRANIPKGVGGPQNMQAMLRQAQKMQEDMAALQAELDEKEYDVSAGGGITSFHAEETSVDRMMIAHAKRTIIAADYTKIGRTGFTHICEAGPEIQLVTDHRCSRDAVRELEALGMDVTIVQ